MKFQKGAFGGEPRRKDVLKRQRKVNRRLKNPSIPVYLVENGLLHRKDGREFS